MVKGLKQIMLEKCEKCPMRGEPYEDEGEVIQCLAMKDINRFCVYKIAPEVLTARKYKKLIKEEDYWLDYEPFEEDFYD